MDQSFLGVQLDVITLDALKQALRKAGDSGKPSCQKVYENVAREWPNGIPVTEASALRAIELKLDTGWLIYDFLTPQEYHEVWVPARDAAAYPNGHDVEVLGAEEKHRVLTLLLVRVLQDRKEIS